MATSNPGYPVSVVIPIYNTGNDLRATVESVLEQTWTDFELILIDDGSGGETRKIVDSFTDPRIRVIHQENRGIAGARNRGIREARGKYIAFLDHDDLWLPEKLSTQLQMMIRDPGAGLCYTPVVYFGDVDSERNISFPPVSGWSEETLLRQNRIVSTSCILVRRGCFGLLGGFDAECVPCDDWDLYLRISRKFRILVTNKPLVLYRLHAGGVSENRERMYRAGLRVLQKYRRENHCGNACISSSSGLKKAWNKSYARHCYGLAWHCMLRGDGGGLLHWFIPVVRHDWTVWRVWTFIPRFLIFRLRAMLHGGGKS